MRRDWPPIGVAGIATELADLRVESDEFARISNIPVEVIERRLGFRQTFRWGDGRGPIAAGVRCASRALAGLDPSEIDVICTIAHPYHPEREIYGYGALLQDALGAGRAELLDVADTCASITLGLQTVRELMLCEPYIRNVLVVGVLSMFDNVDLSNPHTTWMANISDGAGAMLVRRDAQLAGALAVRRGNGPGTPLGYAFASDGTAARQIGIRTEVVDDGPEPDGFFQHEWALAKYYFVREPSRWAEHLELRVAEQLADTIERAAARAALELGDLRAVQTGFLYPSLAERLRDRLGLGRRLRVHTAHGMMGGAELAFALPELIADPNLRDTPVALAGFGLPAHFGAIITTF